jgi:CRP/FNR family transcriptional regulator
MAEQHGIGIASRALDQNIVSTTPIAQCVANRQPALDLRVRRWQRGEYIIGAGDAFRAIHLLTVGSVKAYRIGVHGRHQITAFYLAEDVLGLDAIDGKPHPTFIEALEDCTTIEVPLRGLDATSLDRGALQGALIRQLAHELKREQHLALMLGATTAEERLAVFLLDLGRRYSERGYSPREFVLRMTREEIANHLGLTLETVSRALSKFRRDGALDVDGRRVRICDSDRLSRIAARAA